MADDDHSFGERLRRLMLAKGFNQTRLAKRSGIDRSVLNRLIRGKGQPRPEHLAWLAIALDVEVDALTAGALVSSDVRRAIEHVREEAARVVRVESERDEAVALASQLSIELGHERAQRELVHARLAQAEANQTELRQHVARLERELAAREVAGAPCSPRDGGLLLVSIPRR